MPAHAGDFQPAIAFQPAAQRLGNAVQFHDAITQSTYSVPRERGHSDHRVAA